MGTYMYAVLKGKKIVADNETIHLCKFQFKPYGWPSDNPPLWNARLNRIINSWGDVPLSRLIVIGDKFEDGQEVYDQTKKYDYYRKCPISAKVVFLDDVDGFGQLVGWLSKNGKHWTIKQQHTRIFKGSINGELGTFIESSQVIDGKLDMKYEKIN